MHSSTHAEHVRATKLLRAHGYRVGGEVSHRDPDAAEDKRMVEKAVHQHEKHEHGGNLTKLKLKTGGAVHGEHSAARPDKRARGGPAGGKKGTTVNVVVAHPPGAGAGMPPRPMMPPAAAAVPAGPPMPGAPGMVPAPRPMPPPMPVGGAPMGGALPGVRPPGVMKRGGAVKGGRMKYGAGSGMGRYEKEGVRVPK